MSKTKKIQHLGSEIPPKVDVFRPYPVLRVIPLRQDVENVRVGDIIASPFNPDAEVRIAVTEIRRETVDGKQGIMFVGTKLQQTTPGANRDWELTTNSATVFAGEYEVVNAYGCLSTPASAAIANEMRLRNIKDSSIN